MCSITSLILRRLSDPTFAHILFLSGDSILCFLVDTGTEGALLSHATCAALVACVHKLRDRLPAADAIVALIERGHLAEAVRQLLPYYDKMYRKGLARRSDRVTAVCIDSASTEEGVERNAAACERPRVSSSEMSAYVTAMTDALCRASASSAT